jgi:hypothetical protein
VLYLKFATALDPNNAANFKSGNTSAGRSSREVVEIRFSPSEGCGVSERLWIAAHADVVRFYERPIRNASGPVETWGRSARAISTGNQPRGAARLAPTARESMQGKR